jgi:hypothetical protein
MDEFLHLALAMTLWLVAGALALYAGVQLCKPIEHPERVYSSNDLVSVIASRTRPAQYRRTVSVPPALTIATVSRASKVKRSPLALLVVLRVDERELRMRLN